MFLVSSGIIIGAKARCSFNDVLTAVTTIRFAAAPAASEIGVTKADATCSTTIHASGYEFTTDYSAAASVT